METNITKSTLSNAGKIHLFLAMVGVITAIIGAFVLLNDTNAAQTTASTAFTFVKTPEVNVVRHFSETISMLLSF